MDYLLAIVVCIGAIGGGILGCFYVAASTTAGRKLTLREWLGEP